MIVTYTCTGFQMRPAEDGEENETTSCLYVR